MSILLVDDRSENLLALEAIFDGLGLDLVKARSGEEALGLLADRDFAVILLDVQMGGLDGFQTAKLIRGRERSRHTPIIFLSAFDDGAFPVADAYVLGAVDYLLKPLVPQILRSKVLVFVDLFRKTEQAARAEAAARGRLDTALASVSDMFLTLDHGLRYTYVNDRMVEASGIPREQIIGKRVREVFPDLADTLLETELRRALAMQTTVHFEFYHASYGRWFENRAYPSPEGLMLLTTEITELKRAEEARHYLAAIVESSGDAIISNTLDGIITSWNAGAERLYGYTAVEAIGKHVSLLMPSDRVEDMALIIGRIRRGERVAHFETRRKRKDGSVIDVWLTVSPIRDAAGQVIGASKIARNITEKKLAEKELRRERALLDTFLATAPVGMGFWDRDFRFLRINEALASINGIAPEDHIGHTVAEVLPELWPTLEPFYRQARDGRPVMEMDVSGVTPAAPSETRHWLTSYFPVTAPDGEVLGVGAVINDITERKRTEDALKEADRRKNEFLAMLAHELRNPLAAINNAASVALRSGSKEDLDWGIDVIRRQVGHFTRLIDDLLDASRITQGKIQLRPELIDAMPVLRHAAEAVKPLIDERKHQFVLSFTSTDMRLHADPTRLEQIVVNLLANAAKYTPTGGHIELIAGVEGGEVIFRVRDDGVGIPPEVLPQMFELFAQADRSLARSEGGLGIGLTVARSLAEMHGGTVTASSEGLGKGSEFVVTLPAADAAVAEAPNPSGTAVNEPPRRLRVLVVDDNPDTARGMAKLLRLSGHEVRVAHSGTDALEAAREHRPEAVLLDIGLPGMDGYEVAARLRQGECCRDAVIMAVSGYGDEEARRRSKEAGFDHHLVKPVDYDALPSLIGRSNHRPR